MRVINLSLGRPIFESYKLDPLCQAVEQAWKAGIVVVVAAGNDGRDLNLNPEGYGTIDSPGNDPYVLTVGAMRTMETSKINDDLIAELQLEGALVHRRRRQAGHRGAGQPGQQPEVRRGFAGGRQSLLLHALLLL